MRRAPGPEAPQVGRRNWTIALVAGAASYLDASVLTTVALSLGPWREHFALTAVAAGSVGGGLSLAAAVGPGLGAWLGDRLGRRRVLGLTLVAFLPATALIVLAGNGSVLLLGVVVLGLAAGADLPVSLAVISDAVPPAVLGRLTGLTQLLWILGVVVTYGVGFLVSGSGYVGTQLLAGYLGVLALLILLARARVLPMSTDGGAAPDRREPRHAGALRLGVPLVAVTVFYLAWNLAASTMGSYGVYFMTTVTGFSQRQATGLVLATLPLALLAGVGFVRLADTVWRDRLFLAAMALQVAAFGVGAATGGVLGTGIVVLVVLYSLSNTFAGEAAYKVWVQVLFSSQDRSRALGLSMSIARGGAAAFLVLVPTVIAWRPSALLWLLTAAVVVSGAVGTFVTRRLTTATRPAAELGTTSG